MRKTINILMVILLCVGVIFGTWKKREYFNYVDKGLSPPQSEFCFYDIAETFLAGIVSVWAGINLLWIWPGLSKLIDRTKSPIQRLYGIFFIRCCGLVLLTLGLLSFWNIYMSNLPNCHGL